MFKLNNFKLQISLLVYLILLIPCLVIKPNLFYNKKGALANGEPWFPIGRMSFHKIPVS